MKNIKYNLKSAFIKTFAVLTALNVFISFIFPPYSYALPVSFPLDSSFAKITSFKDYGSPEIIINIRDLHCHP